MKGVLDGRQLALKVQTALADFCPEVTPAGLPLPCSSPVDTRLQYKTPVQEPAVTMLLLSGAGVRKQRVRLHGRVERPDAVPGDLLVDHGLRPRDDREHQVRRAPEHTMLFHPIRPWCCLRQKLSVTMTLFPALPMTNILFAWLPT